MSNNVIMSKERFNIIVFVVQTVACKEPNKNWTSIAISLSGKAAALIDKAGYIWAGSSDFKVQND